MSLSIDQLAAACGCSAQRAELWLPHIGQAMSDYSIVTPKRQAAFLAQVSHESGRLRYVRELWNPEQCPWQGRYEGRADLGNTEPGDGARYMGRGLIQITGRANYRACGGALNLPLEDHPEQLELQKYAAMSAAWFWQSRGLNEMADVGDFQRITRRINGGLNGYADRVARWQRACEAFQA